MGNKTLLFDFNNLALRCLFSSHVSEKSLTGDATEIDYPTWRFTVFNSVYLALCQFKNVDEIILAVDETSWRKKVYSVYKANRKKKENDPIDWNTFYSEMNAYIEDLKENIPFKIIQVQSAEADDVIGILCREVNKEFVIISMDRDYKQCLNSRVKMWDPIKKEYIECADPERFVIESCLQGQNKDNIFNVLTPLDFYEKNPEGTRRPAMGEKKIEKILDEIGLERWLTENNAHARFKENRLVMDLKCSPKILVNRTLEQYNSYLLPDLNNVISFINRQQWRSFSDEIVQVERNLSKLY